MPQPQSRKPVFTPVDAPGEFWHERPAGPPMLLQKVEHGIRFWAASQTQAKVSEAENWVVTAAHMRLLLADAAARLAVHEMQAPQEQQTTRLRALDTLAMSSLLYVLGHETGTGALNKRRGKSFNVTPDFFTSDPVDNLYTPPRLLMDESDSEPFFGPVTDESQWFQAPGIESYLFVDRHPSPDMSPGLRQDMEARCAIGNLVGMVGLHPSLSVQYP